jgi:hypothetical protein
MGCGVQRGAGCSSNTQLACMEAGARGIPGAFQDTRRRRFRVELSSPCKACCLAFALVHRLLLPQLLQHLLSRQYHQGSTISNQQHAP